MPKQESTHPYEEFLAKHRTLTAIVDAVLEMIEDFSHVTSRQDFLAEVQRLNKEQAALPQKQQGLQATLRRQLRPPREDKLTIRRLALICRAAEVALGHTPWHHQILGGLLLNRGLIVEMPNGSGKTLAAALTACLHSTLGNRTHIATYNDYLSERDMRWMGPLYQLLGLSVGVVFSEQSVHFQHGILESDGLTLKGAPRPNSPPRLNVPTVNGVGRELLPGDHTVEQPTSPGLLEMPDHTSPPREELRHETTAHYVIDPTLDLQTVFACDIVYGRIESFGFEYLRDNLKPSPGEQVITQRDMLIVDECDAVLLDDLRTPLIITGPVSEQEASLTRETLQELHKLAQLLNPHEDFIVAGRSVELTYRGLDRITELTGTDFFTEDRCGLAHGLTQALQALHVYHRDVDYLLENGQIVIIDEGSGRLLTGRRYNDGLHEALEIKERLSGSDSGQQKRLLARISIKHFVRTYQVVSGMSGTIGAPEEYRDFYGLETMSVQPFPRTRSDHQDAVLRTKAEAHNYIVNVAIGIAKKGQPVLINVPNLMAIDALAHIFDARGMPFQALDARNARNLTEEAEAVQQAAHPRQITICSKLAARGTDIVVGPEVVDAGGLFVIGLERAMDRRYDDQLRGRTARHGNPGESLFVLSLEDDLLTIFGSQRISSLMVHLGMDNNESIDHPMMSRAIRNAQRKVQRHNRMLRIQAVETDDVLERHRLVFYALRQKILVKSELRDEILTMVDNWTFFKSRTVLQSWSRSIASTHDGDVVFGRLRPYFDTPEVERILQIRSKKRQNNLLKETLHRKICTIIEAQRLEDDVLRFFILTALDTHWARYLEFESSMRDEIVLYLGDSVGAVTQYATRMEERFDTFFYEVGESILAAMLGRVSRPPLAPKSLALEANHG